MNFALSYQMVPLQIYLRYQRVPGGPNARRGEVSPEQRVVAFPLQAEVHEIRLEDLGRGWYHVCGEAVRAGSVLEKGCFWANVVHINDISG